MVIKKIKTNGGSLKGLGTEVVKIKLRISFLTFPELPTIKSVNVGNL